MLTHRAQRRQNIRFSSHCYSYNLYVARVSLCEKKWLMLFVLDVIRFGGARVLHADFSPVPCKEQPLIVQVEIS